MYRPPGYKLSIHYPIIIDVYSPHNENQTSGQDQQNFVRTSKFFSFYLDIYRVKPVLRGHLWDKEKVAL